MWHVEVIAAQQTSDIVGGETGECWRSQCGHHARWQRIGHSRATALLTRYTASKNTYECMQGEHQRTSLSSITAPTLDAVLYTYYTILYIACCIALPFNDLSLAVCYRLLLSWEFLLVAGHIYRVVKHPVPAELFRQARSMMVAEVTSTFHSKVG